MALKALSKELHPSLGTFDGITLDPRDLKPNPDFNGRVELPDVAKFKRDFLDPRVGQIQPISIWKHPQTGQAIILDGVTRWRAALEIVNAGGTFRLQCKYVQCKTEQDAFVFTVKANVRNDPTPADNAHNVAIFLHNFALPMEDIAGRIYGRYTMTGRPDTKWVEEMLSLNSLTPEALKALSAGKLKSSAARALAKLTPDAQRANVERLDRGEKLTAANIRLNGSGSTPDSNGNQPTSDASPAPPARQKFDKSTICAKIQAWIDMELPPHITEMAVENAVRTVLGQLQDEIHCGEI